MSKQGAAPTPGPIDVTLSVDYSNGEFTITGGDNNGPEVTIPQGDNNRIVWNRASGQSWRFTEFSLQYALANDGTGNPILIDSTFRSTVSPTQVVLVDNNRDANPYDAYLKYSVTIADSSGSHTCDPYIINKSATP